MVSGICLPDEPVARTFRQYLVLDHETKKFQPIYPNWDQSYQTFYKSKKTGEEKVISIHDHIRELAIEKWAESEENY